MTARPPERRLPPWLHKRIPAGGHTGVVQRIIDALHLATVCHGAKCPNRAECFACGTLTFMIMGGVCTRACGFCAVQRGAPPPLPSEEPEAVAEAAQRLGLRHVVITSVTRDDLPDGGAAHFAKTVRAVRRRLPSATIEVLTPDFNGNTDAIDCVLDAGCNVFNHNLETVQHLTARVRPQADYDRSLGVLAHAATWRSAAERSSMQIKSGLMLGLGESDDDVLTSLQELRSAGCGVLTLGQYLQPGPENLPVARFVQPAEFDAWRERVLALGFRAVAAGPWVRSSYQADRIHAEADGATTP
jgi:lipoic acid synthetase